MILPLLAEMSGSIHVGLAAMGAGIGVGLTGLGAAAAVGRNPGAATPILVQASCATQPRLSAGVRGCVCRKSLAS